MDAVTDRQGSIATHARNTPQSHVRGTHTLAYFLLAPANTPGWGPTPIYGITDGMV